jgi:pyrroline-5-carboxylate reductase
LHFHLIRKRKSSFDHLIPDISHLIILFVNMSEEKTPESPAAGEASEAPPAEGGEGGSPAPAEASSPSRSSSPKGHAKSRKKGAVDLFEAKIGFVGAGKMAESIINGLISHGKVEAAKIHVAAPSTKSLEKLKQLGCHVTKRSYDIFGRYDCDIVFLCFHGDVVTKCYGKSASHPRALTTNFIPNMKHPLYVLSLVSGGIKLSEIKKTLLNPDHPHKYMIEMHRIMINASCAYGLGLCCVDVEPDSNKLAPIVRELLSKIAKLEFVPEDQMDAACALAGNGLAFAYYYIGAMADGAFKMGLARNTAIKFAAKTAQSAAQSLLESGKHPSELKDSCSSPSGAAVYGLHSLDKADVQSGLQAAVEAAHRRARELAGTLKEGGS